MSHKATSWLSDIPAATLGHSEFRVLFHLCDCHNPSRGCFPTQAYLMEATGASNGTVNNALNGLEAKGLIKRHRERDGASKRQKPTRYILGFEFDAPQGPTPNSGDGKAADPSPNSGDGPVSNSEADPSPIQRPTRLQPTGEKPVKNQERTCARDGGGAKTALAFWADKVRQGGFIPSSAITPEQARAMLKQKLVTAGDLRTAGVAF